MVGSTEGIPGLLERRTAEAQVIGTAVGWILRETMAVHRGPQLVQRKILGPISSALLLPQVSLYQVKNEAIYMPG